MTADTSLFAQAQAWLDEDWARMEKTLGPRLEAFRGKHILVTGAAGFLGFAATNSVSQRGQPRM